MEGEAVGRVLCVDDDSRMVSLKRETLESAG